MQVWRAVTGLEQQPILAVDESLQVLCDVRAQVDLARRHFGFEIADDTRRLSVDLYVGLRWSPVVDEVFPLKSECFRDSHPGRCCQNIQRLLLAFAFPHELSDGFRLERRSTLLF